VPKARQAGAFAFAKLKATVRPVSEFQLYLLLRWQQLILHGGQDGSLRSDHESECLERKGKCFKPKYVRIALLMILGYPELQMVFPRLFKHALKRI
jgi:hypothetical protein